MFFCLYDFCLTFSRSAKHCCTRPVVLHAPSFFSLPSWRVEENTDRGVVGSGKMVGSYELCLYLAFLLGKNAYRRSRAFQKARFTLEKSCSEFGLNGRITASTIGLQPYPPPPASHRPESPRFTTPVRLGRWSLLISHFEYRSKTILFQMVFYMWAPETDF